MKTSPWCSVETLERQIWYSDPICLTPKLGSFMRFHFYVCVLFTMLSVLQKQWAWIRILHSDAQNANLLSQVCLLIVLHKSCWAQEVFLSSALILGLNHFSIPISPFVLKVMHQVFKKNKGGQPAPPPLVCGKFIFHEPGPWVQKGWGLMI